VAGRDLHAVPALALPASSLLAALLPMNSPAAPVAAPWVVSE